MCTPSAPSGAVTNLADIVYGVNVPVYKKIRDRQIRSNRSRLIKECLPNIFFSADEVAYVELRIVTKMENTKIPDNCLSDKQERVGASI